MNAAAGTVNASESKPRKLNPPRLSEAWRRRLPLLPALLIMIVLTQVPFVPTGTRPVYCLDCFQGARR